MAAEFLQAGVGESDVQAGVAFVNGAEEAAEVVPERVRVVGVAMLEGMLEGFGGEQAEVFAKGAEQDPVQQLLAVDDFALEAASEDLESQGQSHPKPRLSESGMKNAE
jgi:hypothetical protein